MSSAASVSPPNWVYDDGGRVAAGYRGKTGDCVARAIAIASERPYEEVYAGLTRTLKDERLKRKRKGTARNGVHKTSIVRYLKGLGWTWKPTMGIGTGCTVHLRREELPPGRLIVHVSKHVVAMIDGVVHDTYDSTRDGNRCVYGYWTAPG